MPFEKGNPGGPGRKKGSKNKKTQDWEKLGNHITGEWAERIIEYGNKLIAEDRMEEFFAIYEKMINYFKPKMASTTIQAEIKVPDVNLQLRSADAMDAMKQLLGPGQEDEAITDAEIIDEQDEHDGSI